MGMRRAAVNAAPYAAGRRAAVVAVSKWYHGDLTANPRRVLTRRLALEDAVEAGDVALASR